MKYNLIKTDNYLLIVDDSEIKEGDYFFFEQGIVTKVFKADSVENNVTIENFGHDRIFNYKSCKKIISHAPLNNSLILEDVPLLPPLEDDVEKLDEEHSPYPKPLQTYEKGFNKGYNKSREKYKFTEEDVIRIVEKSRETGLTAEYLLLTDQFKKK